MDMQVNTIYIGYYNDVILAVSTTKKLLKGYLRDIRGLSKGEYDIYSTILDEDSTYALYEDVILQEYYEGLFLTTRDIDVIEKEVECNFHLAEDTLRSLRDYHNSLSGVKVLDDYLRDIRSTIKETERLLTSQKNLNKMKKHFIRKSPVLSPDINTYLKSVSYYLEDKELREMFLTKLYDGK